MYVALIYQCVFFNCDVKENGEHIFAYELILLSRKQKQSHPSEGSIGV